MGIQEEDCLRRRNQRADTAAAIAESAATMETTCKGALRGERKDSMTVNTSEETGITDFRSNDEGESKRRGQEEGDDTRMSYFAGRGTGDDVPAFLRFNGRVRNRHLSKGQVERIVRTVWVRGSSSATRTS